MRSLVLLAALGLAVASASPVEAAPPRHAKIKKAAGARKPLKAKDAHKGQLVTDVSFDDSVLHGEYQSPEEALAKVENEKGLSDLIGVRKHFKDRLSEAAEQE